MREFSSMSLGGGVSPFAALERCPLFEGIERGDLMTIAMQMQPRSFDTGERLTTRGEHGDGMLVIATGIAYELAPDDSIVAKRRRGDAVGAVSLVTGEPRSATVVAGIPTEALELSRDGFDSLVERHPVILRNVTRILSGRLERSSARAARAGDRGEAVGLIVGPSLAGAVPELVESVRAASPQSVESLDTRGGFDQAVAQLDDLLDENGIVLMVARAEGKTAPFLLEHVDRALVLVEDEREAERFADAPHAEVRRIEGGTIPPAELAWLGRHLARTKLGLALGAGGAKGYAHVGALRVLEEAGYTVDFVSGSSIGAIVGAYLALGMDAEAIDTTLRESFSPDNVAETFKLTLSGGSTGLDLMERLMRETTGERSFDDVQSPLAIMSVDLTDREPAPIREGPLWEALMAATALAGMFPPYERGGHRLVDGLALDPVPTSSLLEDGADVTVSVNLMARDTLPAWPGQDGPPPRPPKRQRGSRMLDTLLEVMDLMQLDTSIRGAELADVPITPMFGPGSWRDFHLADLFLEAGRAAAEEQLPALLTLARPQPAGVPT
jgi:predicted acylesterase/phospholipase RssA